MRWRGSRLPDGYASLCKDRPSPPSCRWARERSSSRRACWARRLAAPSRATSRSRSGSRASIRPFSTIYAGSVIGHRFQTGQGVSIRENNVIGDDVSIGTNCRARVREPHRQRVADPHRLLPRDGHASATACSWGRAWYSPTTPIRPARRTGSVWAVPWSRTTPASAPTARSCPACVSALARWWARGAS